MHENPESLNLYCACLPILMHICISKYLNLANLGLYLEFDTRTL